MGVSRCFFGNEIPPEVRPVCHPLEFEIILHDTTDSINDLANRCAHGHFNKLRSFFTFPVTAKTFVSRGGGGRDFSITRVA